MSAATTGGSAAASSAVSPAATTELIAVFGALSDETRWAILAELGRSDASASVLAQRLPVTRQAIAKHLSVLEHSGLVDSYRAGREVRYRALGAQLSETARALERIGAQWDRRLAALKRAVEGG